MNLWSIFYANIKKKTELNHEHTHVLHSLLKIIPYQSEYFMRK